MRAEFKTYKALIVGETRAKYLHERQSLVKAEDALVRKEAPAASVVYIFNEYYRARVIHRKVLAKFGKIVRENRMLLPTTEGR